MLVTKLYMNNYKTPGTIIIMMFVIYLIPVGGLISLILWLLTLITNVISFNWVFVAITSIIVSVCLVWIEENN
jgi:hypothetical protein